MSINLLPDEIVNQIAAGEVIENPAAVIKELVENSIDANATQIDVEVEQSGLKKIVIKDNGNGISKDDLLKAPVRHATSKIKRFSDLYNINTMGFRGEALASIFSVAKTRILSRQEDQSYEISSQNKQEVKESASQKGTIIEVDDIFYNTPTRKKYLKSDNLELKAIVDVVTRFTVYHHDIKFTLKHNSKTLINKPRFRTKEENLYYTLGRELKDDLLYLNSKRDGIKVSGFLGKPSNINYAYKKNQYLYVNSRYIKSKLISNAIYDGFSTNLMEGRHPLFVLFIDIDPEIVDVNVHPTKIEMKFENELEIFEFVKGSIRELFKSSDTIKPFEPKLKDRPLSQISSQIGAPREYSKESTHDSHYTKDSQRALSLQEEELDYRKEDPAPQYLSAHEPQSDTENKEEPSYGPLYDILKDYRIVGQIDKTFIIVETPKEMILLDQHVVEEKFFYETIKEKVENQKVRVQKLLKPDILNLSRSEMLLFKENSALFEKLGFEIEEFGPLEIIVRAVPLSINNKEISPYAIKDMLAEITIDKRFKHLEEKTLEKIASLSCKKSLKGGEELTTPQIHKMIENLKRLEEPFNCPHGRPIMLRYTFRDLEKKFKRIV